MALDPKYPYSLFDFVQPPASQSNPFEGLLGASLLPTARLADLVAAPSTLNSSDSVGFLVDALGAPPKRSFLSPFEPSLAPTSPWRLCSARLSRILSLLHPRAPVSELSP